MPLAFRRCALPLAAALVLLGSAAGCGDSESTAARLRDPSVDSSDTRAHRLAGLVERTDTLSTLARALRRVGLMQDLRQGGPYTLFAPTDRAFQRQRTGFDSLLAPAGSSSVAAQQQQHPPSNATAAPAHAVPAHAVPAHAVPAHAVPAHDSLRSLLRFHLVRGRFAAGHLADSLRLGTVLTGKSLKLERGRSKRGRLRVRVDGMSRPVPVRRTLKAQNGVLHLLSRPLRIPTPDTSAEGALGDTTAAPDSSAAH